MRKSLLAVTIAVAFCALAQETFAQQTAVSTGGAGGQGGAAAGGSAAGGAATNSNTITSGGGQGGVGGQASGGAASATGVQTGAINSTGNTQASEVTVNYIQSSGGGGLKGLAAGVDPETGHVVYDNNVRYSGTQKLKNTPDAPIAGPASGPCNGFSGGIGVSVPGFAVGANTSTVDPGCTARETARIAAMMGRMDIANAVLENTTVVQEALKAKAARLAAAEATERIPTAAPAQNPPVQTAPARQVQDRAIEEARLKEQQRVAVETLQRKSTMDKVYDTMTFTDAVSQGSERTPQQVMAEEANKKLAEKKRDEEQVQLERRLAALKAESEVSQNRREPLVQTAALAQAQREAAPSVAPVNAPAAATAAPAPATFAQAQAAMLPAQAPAQQAPVQQAPVQQAPAQQAPAQQAPAQQAPAQQAPVAQATAPAQQAPVAQAPAAPPAVASATAKAPQRALDPAEAARLLRNEPPPVARNAEPPPAPRNREANPPPSREATQIAAQPMLQQVKADKASELFGFKNAKGTEDGAPDASAQRPAPKATEAAAKPAGDPKKPQVVPADALNFARAPISVQ